MQIVPSILKCTIDQLRTMCLWRRNLQTDAGWFVLIVTRRRLSAGTEYERCSCPFVYMLCKVGKRIIGGHFDARMFCVSIVFLEHIVFIQMVLIV